MNFSMETVHLLRQEITEPSSLHQMGPLGLSRTSDTTNALYGGAYSSPNFVLVGASGKVIRSSDGTSWTSPSLDSLTTDNIFGFARGGTT